MIVGLGNPGQGYANSLHNLGFMCLNYFARKHHIRFNKKQAKARVGKGEISDSELIVARPQTYMNQSGQAVSRLVKKHKVNLDNLLVVHDDLDLPLGKIRFSSSGGSGGHKGVTSIIHELGSPDFIRLRVGIGRPSATNGLPNVPDADIVTYLVSELPLEEKKAINQIMPKVSEAVLCLLTEGLTAAMNKYN